MSTVNFRGITPYLHYEDAAASLEWLARVFGFEEGLPIRRRRRTRARGRGARR
jgi:uncharacterized glyoxalase superfamily protein PhnB